MDLAQEKLKAENLRELLKQQWEHARHIELERSYLLMAYGAILAVFLAFGSGGEPILNLEPAWLLIFLLNITFFCFFLTTRWTYAFECHREKANKIARLLWQQTGDRTHLDPTFNIPPIQTLPPKVGRFKLPTGWINNVTRTRYLYSIFYLVFLFAFALLSFTTLQKVTSFHLIMFKFRQIPENPIPIINQWGAVLISLLAIVSSCNWYKSLKVVGQHKVIVLEGCNGDWAQKQYLLPLLKFNNEGADKPESDLFAADISKEIRFSSTSIAANWHKVLADGKAGYINKNVDKSEYETMATADLIFIVTPPECHIKIAELWLPKLGKAGKIFIEKPIDVSLKEAENFKKFILQENKKDTVFGFDHYLARTYPFLKNKKHYLNKINKIVRIEFKILENSPIPAERLQTLDSGIIFDLFCHVLSVVITTVSNKQTCSPEQLNDIVIENVVTANCLGSRTKGETFARINFSIKGIKVDVTLGKCVGNSEEKVMVITGKNGDIKLDFLKDEFFIDSEKMGNLNNRHVGTFIKKVLELNEKKSPASIPGVLSFDTALEILRTVTETKNKLHELPNYSCGTSVEEILSPRNKGM